MHKPTLCDQLDYLQNHITQSRQEANMMKVNALSLMFEQQKFIDILETNTQYVHDGYHDFGCYVIHVLAILKMHSDTKLSANTIVEYLDSTINCIFKMYQHKDKFAPFARQAFKMTKVMQWFDKQLCQHILYLLTANDSSAKYVDNAQASIATINTWNQFVSLNFAVTHPKWQEVIRLIPLRQKFTVVKATPAVTDAPAAPDTANHVPTSEPAATAQQVTTSYTRDITTPLTATSNNWQDFLDKLRTCQSLMQQQQYVKTAILYETMKEHINNPSLQLFFAELLFPVLIAMQPILPHLYHGSITQQAHVVHKWQHLLLMCTLDWRKFSHLPEPAELHTMFVELLEPELIKPQG